MIVAVSRPAPQDTTRAEVGAISRILWVIGQLGLLFGIEVIEVAEELVEPVYGRQRLVAITDVVFAELPGRISKILQ